MAVNRQCPSGARGQGISLRSDNGCQPTSLAFMRARNTLEIHQAFTSYNSPKCNADTERVMRTFKEECLWLSEWGSPFELISALEAWIAQRHAQIEAGSLVYIAHQLDFLGRVPVTPVHEDGSRSALSSDSVALTLALSQWEMETSRSCWDTDDRRPSAAAQSPLTAG